MFAETDNIGLVLAVLAVALFALRKYPERPEDKEPPDPNAPGCLILVVLGFLWFIAWVIAFDEPRFGKPVSRGATVLVVMIPFIWVLVFLWWIFPRKK